MLCVQNQLVMIVERSPDLNGIFGIICVINDTVEKSGFSVMDVPCSMAKLYTMASFKVIIAMEDLCKNF